MPMTLHPSINLNAVMQITILVMTVGVGKIIPTMMGVTLTLMEFVTMATTAQGPPSQINEIQMGTALEILVKKVMNL